MDVMGMIRWAILEVQDNGGGAIMLDWAGTEDAPITDGKDVGTKRVGPIICGKQSGHFTIEMFSAECEGFTTDQAEEVALKDNLFQNAPHMFMEVAEERRERDGALVAAIDAARQHGLAPECGERLRRLGLEVVLEAFRRVLCEYPLGRLADGSSSEPRGGSGASAAKNPPEKRCGVDGSFCWSKRNYRDDSRNA